jgi:hypothetical protein
MSISAEVDERTLREIYLRAFQRVISRHSHGLLQRCQRRTRQFESRRRRRDCAVLLGSAGVRGGPPVARARGVRKVVVEAGGSAVVTTRIPLTDLDYWSSRSRQWVRAGGTYTIQAAASSRDIRAQVSIELVGTEPATPLTLDSAMGEWFADAEGSVALQEMMAQFATQGVGEWDDATLPLVLPMPLRTILPMAASKLPFPC